MRLNSEREVANTRAKLARLEARYEALRHETGGDEHLREITMGSLKRLINQFKEEIAWFEAHQPAGRRTQRLPGLPRPTAGVASATQHGGA